jgi:hypothetical protein
MTIAALAEGAAKPRRRSWKGSIHTALTVTAARKVPSVVQAGATITGMSIVTVTIMAIAMATEGMR